jgi:hypothetical protein
MLRLVPAVAAVLVIPHLLSAGAASAAEGPLAAIPEDAAVVARWKTPKATFAKSQKLVEQADAGIGGQMRGFGFFLGVLVSNPTLAGVDEKRDWWAAVFHEAQAEPQTVFIVPATDADAARQAVGGGFHFVSHGDWLLYTDQEPLADRIKARIAGEGRSIEAVIGEESRELLEAADLAAFVNVRKLVGIYKTDLDGVVAQVEGELSMAENLPIQPAFDIRSVIGLYRNLFRAVIQALRDSETLTVGVSAGDGGFGIEHLLTVQAESATARLMQQHAPSDIDLLGKLPADLLAYVGFHGDLHGLTRWAAEFEASMFPAGGDVKKAIAEMVEGYRKIKLGDYAMAVQLADLETGFIRATMVTEVDSPEAVRDLTRKTVVRMGNIDAGDFKQQVELRTNAEAYGPLQADITTVRQQFNNDNPFGQGQEQIMQMMFGPEGLTTRLVYPPGAAVQTLGGGRSTMEAALKALAGEQDAAAGRQPAFTAVRKQLSDQANVIVIADVPGAMADVLRLVSASGIPVPLTEEDAKALELERTYSGLSLTAGATTLRAKVWVPVEQAQGIAKVVRTVEKLANEPEF